MLGAPAIMLGAPSYTPFISTFSPQVGWQKEASSLHFFLWLVVIQGCQNL